VKIALIGATGFIGTAALKEASARGHSVSAIVRNPEKVETLPGVTPVKADVTKPVALKKVATGHDVIIAAFNGGWGDPDIYRKQLEGSRAIIAAAKDIGTRLIMIGGAGSLELEPGKQLVDSPDFPSEWKEGARGARDALTEIRNETGLVWSFVSSPIHLAPGERTGKFRLGGDQPVFDANGESSASVEDLAVAIVDEAETPKHIGRRFTLGY
jgi:uncharacterized protein